MRALSKTIQQQTNIKRLSLDFSWCVGIVDEAAIALISGITNLNYLEELNINFSGSNKITDETLSYIGEIIKLNV